jgi:dihydrofolate reductase
MIFMVFCTLHFFAAERDRDEGQRWQRIGKNNGHGDTSSTDDQSFGIRVCFAGSILLRRRTWHWMRRKSFDQEMFGPHARNL